MPEFYVYQTRGFRCRDAYPNNWVQVGRHATIEAAEAQAESLVKMPKDRIHTEPCSRGGMAKKFFGSAFSKNWTAMIEDHDIHERKAKCVGR